MTDNFERETFYTFLYILFPKSYKHNYKDQPDIRHFSYTDIKKIQTEISIRRNRKIKETYKRNSKA